MATLEQEKQAVEEMLFAVLYQIGEEVEVTAETLRNLPRDHRIEIKHDVPRDVFVFSIAGPDA